MSKRQINRRDFVRFMTIAGIGGLTGCYSQSREVHPPSESLSNTAYPILTQTSVNSKTTIETQNNLPEKNQVIPTPSSVISNLAVVHGEDPASITATAIKILGGIETFVKPGYDVIIKPNICTDYYSYEYAATTNPEVVATLVKLCLGAGARRVRVMDMPFGGKPESAYIRSGIEDAVKVAGGEMELMNQNKYVKTSIPKGMDIKEWDIYADILKADVLINVPIAKHHSLARLTLGGKNLLGVIKRPSMMHSNLGQRLADLMTVVRPTITLIDAVRILMRNGPTGGDLNDVKLTNTVIASKDTVAVDSYGATLFGLKGEDISYIRDANDMKQGTMDLNQVNIEEVSL